MMTAARLALRSFPVLAGISVFALMGLSAIASAQTPPAIDGDLEDMLQYAADLQAAEIGCPIVIDDPQMDVGVNDPSFIPCVPVVSNYYVNGFDHNKVVVIYDGSDFYLGMRVEGVVGDSDGNGDPDNNNCTAPMVNIGDEPGIGLSESYRWFLDLNCDEIFEVMIEVNNNTVHIGGLATGPATFDYNGSDIEVLVEDVDIIPLFRTQGFSGHLFDGLGEDLSIIAECPPLSPEILIEKSVDDVCPGLITTVNVQVENTGVVALDPVDIEDTLPPGFTYIGGSASNIPEGNQVGDVVTFPSIVLGPGEVRSFSFDIQAPADCAGVKTNLISVVGAFTHPCVEENNNTLLIVSEGSADFECTPTCVELTGENVETCVGSSVDVPLSVLNCSDFVEDIVIEYTLNGVAQSPIVFNDVPAGGTAGADIPVLCEEEGQMTVVATVTGSKDGEPECFSIDEGTFTVTCLQAAVEIAAEGTDNCVGDEFTIPVTVTNTSSGTQTFTVNCSVGGVPQTPVVLTGVPSGESREVEVPVVCTEPGEVEVACSVVAELEQNPDCTAEDEVTVTAVCREAGVSVVAEDTQTCFGTEVLVPVTVTNESSEAANLEVSCTVGGVVQPLQSFPNVPAGESRMFNVTVLCGDLPPVTVQGDGSRDRLGIESAGGAAAPQAEEISVVCEAAATLVSNPLCFAADATEATVTCREACVEIVMEDVETCVGTSIGVPVTVENCATEAADLVVTCLVKGEAQSPVVFENVEAGGIREFNVDVLCEEEEEVLVECTVVSTLVSNQECTAEDAASATVTCLEAAVEIAAVGTDMCVGDEFTIPVTVTNTSSGVETFTVNCSVGGVVQAPVEFTGVPAGESREVMVPVVCEEPGEVEVTCTVLAYLERNEECTAEDAVTVTAVCREAVVSIDAQSAETCVGEEIVVPVTVTNESLEAADLDVTCTVGGVPRAPESFAGVPAGESRVVNVTVSCSEAGEVEVACAVTATLVANENCTDEANIAVTVTCGEACVEIAAEDTETCVGTTLEIPFEVENCAGEPADLVINCSVGGTPFDQVTFENVPAGETRTVNIPLICEEVGEVEVSCSVAASLVSNPECTDEASSTIVVTCLEACVEIAAQDVEVCVGETAIVNVGVKNCSQGTENITLYCSIGDHDLDPMQIHGLEAGDSTTVTVEVLCEEGGVLEVSCTATAELADNPECTDEAADQATITCLTPDVDIEKSTNPVTTQDDSKVTLVVRNTGTSVLDPVQVSDHLPAGLAFDTNQTIQSDCGVSLDRVEEMGGSLWVYFTGFSLDPGDSCTIMYDVGCIEFDNEARVDTAVVTAWCDGIDSDNPENLIYAVSDTSTAEVICQGGEACPHTIGFWRQQCAQKLNGSTKVCLEGMHTLWRCVIEETGVVNWKRNDGSMESTADLAELDDAALFQILCDQLQGPRPMTHRDMAEIQYLGLMLNVCSGALPRAILLEGSAGFSGTVGEAIEAIENAINTGQNITHWKDVADAINNGVGVMAEPCPGGDDLFRNIEPCGPGVSPASVGLITQVRLRAFPNPVRGASSVVRYAVPVHQDMSRVSVRVFDVSGRLVRTLVEDRKPMGEYEAAWDLRDQSGGQVAAGIYFYRLQVGDENRTQRLLVIRSE